MIYDGEHVFSFPSSSLNLSNAFLFYFHSSTRSMQPWQRRIHQSSKNRKHHESGIIPGPFGEVNKTVLMFIIISACKQSVSHTVRRGGAGSPPWSERAPPALMDSGCSNLPRSCPPSDDDGCGVLYGGAEQPGSLSHHIHKATGEAVGWQLDIDKLVGKTIVFLRGMPDSQI